MLLLDVIQGKSKCKYISYHPQVYLQKKHTWNYTHLPFFYYFYYRKSSPALAKAVVEGVKCFEGEVKDYGIITTPILHFMVVCVNTNGEYGMATEEGYYSKITSAFRKIVEKVEFNFIIDEIWKNWRIFLTEVK